MGAGYWLDPLIFLLGTAFKLLILACLLRFLLQFAAADYRNPISQFLIRATDPLLRPLRAVLPATARVDTAALIGMIILQLAYYALMLWLLGRDIPLERLPGATVAELIVLTTLLFTITLLIQVVISWVNPGAWHPGIALLYQLNAPVLAPARRLLPISGGLDLSPLVTLIALVVIRMLAQPFALPGI